MKLDDDSASHIWTRHLISYENYTLSAKLQTHDNSSEEPSVVELPHSTSNMKKSSYQQGDAHHMNSTILYGRHSCPHFLPDKWWQQSSPNSSSYAIDVRNPTQVDCVNWPDFRFSLDCFTVFLHNINFGDVQVDCQWPIKVVDIATGYMTPNPMRLRQF